VNLKRTTLVALSFLALGSAYSQDPRAPYRIQIHHADPWAVKAMLEGMQITTPEISSIPGFKGITAAAGASMNKLLKSGYLVVNPTDNSLWLFPDKAK